MTKKRRSTFVAEQKRRKAEAEKDAAQVRPIVAKDPDWPLVTGQAKLETAEDRARERRGCTRITKRAVQALYPKHTVHVRYDRGTASYWVLVDLIMPELDFQKVRGTPRQWEYKGVWRRIEGMLVALGIQYATYLTDHGRNDSWQPCLLVTVNGAG
jgi:hypothetical protein